MTHIRSRRGTAAEWVAANPVLRKGETGWETDTRQGKMGDGVSAWNSLPYLLPGPAGPPGPNTIPTQAAIQAEVLTPGTPTNNGVVTLIDTKVPAATTAAQGKVELATNAEVTTGTDTVRAVTPAGVKTVLDPIRNLSDSAFSTNLTAAIDAEINVKVPAATTAVQGKVELATTVETQTGTDTVRAVTPAGAMATFPPRTLTKTVPSPGVIDWGFGAGAAGYLLHLTSQVGSVFNEFAIGIGTDAGSGGGILLALKNGAGVGLRILQDPGSAVAVYHDNYSSSLAAWHRIYSGGGAFRVDAAAGAGFTDGVANAASTNFDSTAAAFVPGDTGATLTITHTSGGAVVNSSFTVTYVSATRVTLSGVAGITGTGLRFTLSGRVGLAAQTLIEARDTDGTTTLFKVGRGEHLFSGSAGQVSSIFKIFKAGNGTAVFEIDSTGKQFNRFGSDYNNAGQTGQIPLAVRNYGTGVPSVQIQGVAAQGTDQLRIMDVSGTIQSRFNKDGYFMSRKTTVPADADLANGEFAEWLDATPGATKLMIKAKDSGGTVRTAAIALT